MFVLAVLAVLAVSLVLVVNFVFFASLDWVKLDCLDIFSLHDGSFFFV